MKKLNKKITWKDFYSWEKQTNDTVDFKKIYVDISDDLVSGLLLSQIVYWHLPSKKGGGRLKVRKKGHLWLAKTRNDWWNECRIKPRQVDRALKFLKKKNLVEIKKFKFNASPTTHIRLTEVFLTSIMAAAYNQMDITKRLYGSNESVKSITETTYIDPYNGLSKKALTDTKEVEQLTNYQKSVISLYCKVYERCVGQEHPRLKTEQLLRIANEIKDFEFAQDLDVWSVIIDKHFSTKYSIDIDYNMNHFANQALLENRYFEEEYYTK